MAKLVLIGSILDLNIIPQELLNDADTKIFSFDLQVHRELQSRKIKHEMADNLLSQEERLQLFDKGLEFLNWPSKVPHNDLEFEGVNLLKLFDTHEFHSYLMPTLVNFVIIKRLIAKEHPTKIIATNPFSDMVQSIIKGISIDTEFFQNKNSSKLLWDRITIKYNIGKIPISFNLSKSNYLKIKKLVESTVGFFYDFWIDRNSPKRKSIILLEFNPEYFSNFLQKMKDYDGNVILVNQRRSALWSKKSISIVRKSKCKVLNFDRILTRDEKQKIPLLTEEYSKKFEKMWRNTEFFNNLFQIEDCSFWNVIKDVIMKSYSEKLDNFILLVCGVKNLFKNMEIKCIVSLNEIGESEKAFLEFNQKKIPSILLEHGFVERVNETKRFDKLLYVNFKDRIATWGEIKKEHLINEYGISPDRIIVTGSPRHDDYFNSRIEKKRSEEITVLLAPNPITEISGLASTNLELKFEDTIKKVISILKKFDNVNIIVKLHQIQIKHNQEINSIIKQIDDTIPIYSTASVIDTVNQADVVVVISSESFGTSTMLMESMVLGKPTMNIILDDKIPQFIHVKDKAILTISNNSDLENSLGKILFDTNFQKELTKNADTFLRKFLSYRGNASENFAIILKSF